MNDHVWHLIAQVLGSGFAIFLIFGAMRLVDWLFPIGPRP